MTIYPTIQVRDWCVPDIEQWLRDKITENQKFEGVINKIYENLKFNGVENVSKTGVRGQNVS